MIDEGSIQGQVTAGETCIQDVKPVNKTLKHTNLGKQRTTANTADYLRHKDPHWHLMFLMQTKEKFWRLNHIV